MHRLETKQFVPSGLEETWAFFSNPMNLSRITPPDMGFRIIGNCGDTIYAGMIISYKVKPLLGIPLTWVTEITHVREGSYFVDEQRIGPYRLWHHQHHFKEINGGVEMVDIVNYALPLGFVGSLLNAFLVRNKLEDIFNFRRLTVEDLFGKENPSI